MEIRTAGVANVAHAARETVNEIPREVIKARAAALGVLASRTPRTTEARPPDAPAPPTVDMDRISGLTIGWGAQLDDLLDEDRGRA